MDLTKLLAELETEIYLKHYLKAEELKEHLKILNSYSVNELEHYSKYCRADILKIYNYWKGLSENEELHFGR